MRDVLCALILLSAVLGAAESPVQAQRGLWPPVNATAVRGYAFGPPTRLITDGQPSPGMAMVKLDDAQVARLVAATTGDHPPLESKRCYIPRHGFVFFADDTVIGWIEICFECHQYRFSVPTDQNIDLTAIARLVADLGLR